MQKILLDKICLNEYGFSKEFCHQLGDKGMRRRNEFLSGNNTLIQNEAAQFGVYASVIDHLIPVIVAIFLGAWSDRFGRKFLLYIFFFFAIIDACEKFKRIQLQGLELFLYRWRFTEFLFHGMAKRIPTVDIKSSSSTLRRTYCYENRNNFICQ